MPDYTDLGLTSNFQSVNSLGQNSVFVNGADFDLNQDRSIITESKLGTGVIRSVNMGTAVIGTAQIGTLSFNEITGGTATLGGTNNGNGLLTLKSASGGTIGRINNTGIFLEIDNQSFNFGTAPKSQLYFTSGTPRGLFSIDTLSDNIRLETDNGNITLYASQDPTGTGYGTISLAIGTGAQLRIDRNSTQIAKLDANGNLTIAGTLGTGITF